MADRSVQPSNTFEQFRTTFNQTAEDVGDIADLKAASGIIASSTDVVEAIVALNSSINTLDSLCCQCDSTQVLYSWWLRTIT